MVVNGRGGARWTWDYPPCHAGQPKETTYFVSFGILRDQSVYVSNLALDEMGGERELHTHFCLGSGQLYASKR